MQSVESLKLVINGRNADTTILKSELSISGDLLPILPAHNHTINYNTNMPFFVSMFKCCTIAQSAQITPMIFS